MQLKLPFSLEVLERTPPEVIAFLRTQQEEIGTLEQENARLKHRLADLQARLARLDERLRQDSTNSSKPPSSDPPSRPKPNRRRPPSGRRRGGQPGHAFADRPLLPLEEVSAIVPVKPSHCEHCHAPLRGDDPEPEIRQITEIPPLIAHTTEYQRHCLVCSKCGEATEADWPEDLPSRSFGPRLQAWIAACVGLYRLSKRQTQQLLQDCFGIDISLGAIADLEQATSQALADPVAAAQEYVQQQGAVHVDETGWREGDTKPWLWTVATALVTIFVIRPSRGARVLGALLGHAFAGFVHSDRWSAYRLVPLHRRQLCWAHLRRDWQAFCDRGGTSKRLGQRLLVLTDQMFTWWQRVRDGTMARWEFRIRMRPVMQEVGALLRQGKRCAQPQTRGTCADILSLEAALWTFVFHEGLEPTNNAAERALRHWVLWRKTSGGTKATAGTLWMERLMTTVTTLRQQQRNVLDYLTAACAAKMHGTPAPSLLPDAPAAALAG